MYKLIVISLLCFGRLSFGELKTEMEDDQLKVCVGSVIRNNFDQHETLFFLTMDYDNISFVGLTDHPYVMINLMNSIKKFPNYMNYKPIFITHLTFLHTFRLLPNLYKSVLWSFYNTIQATYVLITPSHLKSSIFEEYWSVGVVNLVLISYNKIEHNYYVRIYTGNPQAEENQCGTQAIIVNSQRCTSAIRIQFPKIVRKYKNCNVTLFQTAMVNSSILKTDCVTLMVGALTTHLGASLRWILDPTQFRKFSLQVSTLDFTQQGKVHQSQVIEYDDFVWVVPTPRKLHPMEVLKIVFKESVWFAILLSYCITSIIWWLLSKLISKNTSISSVLLDLYSITLFGSSEKAPAHLSLKLIFVCYIVYSIHIQTAFTCNLINILTTPQFEKPITTLEELANTNDPIFISKMHYERYFYNESVKSNLYNKIQKKLVVCDVKPFRHFIFTKETYANSSFLYTRDMVEVIETYLSIKIYKITDNSITTSHKGIIVAPYNSYFAETLYKLISVFVEAGLQDQILKKIEYPKEIDDVIKSDPPDLNQIAEIEDQEFQEIEDYTR
ncbi:hypothetical protein FQR65_LT19313 [Abscondita terminalis]|nr:hypothetical protein FQR65_LT19313 [Abscondita terminalis]